MDPITPEQAAQFIEAEWKHAHDVKVESIRVDSEGNSNAWTVWEAYLPSDGGEIEVINLSQNIKLRRDADGEIVIL